MLEILKTFAKMLGIEPGLAEDALHSESAARHVLTRRSFFGASAAMAAGAVFSFGSGDLYFLERGPFFGVDRKIHPERLTGVRVTAVTAERLNALLKSLYSYDERRAVFEASEYSTLRITRRDPRL